MAREALNKLNYRRFKERCLGARISEVKLTRNDRGGQLKLRYDARPPRSRMQLHGEWIIARKGREADDVAALETRFLEMIESDFSVKRLAGFASVPGAPGGTEEAS